MTENRNAAITKLLDLERRGGLWNERVLGYPVWGLTRLNRYSSMLTQRATGFEVERGGGVRGAVKRFAPPVVRSLSEAGSAVAKLADHDFWLLDANSHRRRDGDRDVCIFAEHLRDQLGERLLEIEYDAGGRVADASHHLLRLDAAMIGALASGEILGRAAAPALVDAAQRARFDVEKGRGLVRSAVYGHVMERLADAALDIGRPRAVFVLCGYNFHIPWQRAARRRRIPVVELQHGIIHESHSGYVFDAAPDFAPDHLVVFGEHFGELLERANPYWKGRWSVGSHDWLARKRRLDGERARDSVVLFTQYLPALREPLREWVPAIRAALPKEVTLVVKPHPREIDADDFYARVLGDGVRLASHQEDSYQLLNRALVAASYYSTISIEALAYPCHAVAIESEHWTADIRRFVDAGFLKRVGTPEGLAALATTPIADDGDGDLAQRLFGIGAPRLDFQGLVDGLRK